MKNKLLQFFATSRKETVIRPLTPEAVEFHQLVDEKIRHIKANIVAYATHEVCDQLEKRHEKRHGIVEGILAKDHIKHGTGEYEKAYRESWEGLFGKMPQSAKFSKPGVNATLNHDKGDFEPEI